MTKTLVALAVGAAICGLASVTYTTAATADEKTSDDHYRSYSYGKYEEKGRYKKCEYKNEEGYKYETYYTDLKKYYKFVKLSCDFDLGDYAHYEKEYGFPCSYYIKKDHRRYGKGGYDGGYHDSYKDTTYYSVWYTDPYKKKGYLRCVFRDDYRDYLK